MAEDDAVASESVQVWSEGNLRVICSQVIRTHRVHHKDENIWLGSLDRLQIRHQVHGLRERQRWNIGVVTQYSTKLHAAQFLRCVAQEVVHYIEGKVLSSILSHRLTYFVVIGAKLSRPEDLHRLNRLVTEQGNNQDGKRCRD